VSTLAVIVGLGLGLGLAAASWQARLALASWLAYRRETDKPAPERTPVDAALVARLEAVEGELSRLKVERLTGRR
jgi:hypothetical protein